MSQFGDEEKLLALVGVVKTTVAARKLKLLLCDRDKNNINRCGILTLFVGGRCLSKRMI